MLPASGNFVQWSKWIRGKVNYFVWQASMNRIPISTSLTDRGITNDGTCSLCGYQLENVDHVLLNRHVLLLKFEMPFSHGVTSHNLQFTYMNSMPLTKDEKKLHLAIIHSTFWCTWKARNERIFTGKLRLLVTLFGILPLAKK